MKANETLPETVPQEKQEFRPYTDHQRMLNGFTATLLGNDAYFEAIDAQVDLAMARQSGARQ
jgi:hypothetical protein